MKKILFALLILFSFSANAAEPSHSGYLKLPSGKSIKVITYGDLKIPAGVALGKTFQIMYETKISTTDSIKLRKEADEVLQYLKPQINSGNYQTVYIRAAGEYTGKMLTSKNGEDFKFTRSRDGEWLTN